MEPGRLHLADDGYPHKINGYGGSAAGWESKWGQMAICAIGTLHEVIVDMELGAN